VKILRADFKDFSTKTSYGEQEGLLKNQAKMNQHWVGSDCQSS